MKPIFDDNTSYIVNKPCSCGCYKHCGSSCHTDDCDCNECQCPDCKDNEGDLNG